MKKRAFTLIELLVVIAIIAILAAILFPVFAQAREKARQTQCASNEKQIGLALLQYIQDFDETAPPICEGTCAAYSNSSSLYWMDEIYPYVKSQQVFTCPSDTSSNARYAFAGNYIAPSQNNGLWGSYSANDAFDAAPNRTTITPPFSSYSTPYGPTTLAKMAAPATTIFVIETATQTGIPYANEYSWDFKPFPNHVLSVNSTGLPFRVLYDTNRTDLGMVAERHSGQTNILWCDGHVKSMTVDKLLVTTTNSSAQTVYPYFTCEADPY